MVGCPVGSIRRRNSLEVIIEDWCIGCGLCAKNCPYGNINLHPFTVTDRQSRRTGQARRGDQAKGDFLRSVHRSRRAQLRLRLPARCGASRGPESSSSADDASIDLGELRTHAHRPHTSALADRDHRLAFLAALIAYVVYALRTPGGPRGGTAIGLTFGIVGYAVMLFAGLLGAAQESPGLAAGPGANLDARALWLGLLTLPLILFHAGFAFRGPLTRC